MSEAPELAVVVLSYRNEGTILGAVDSLLAQDEPLELVVSHSGGGPTPALLNRHRPGVRVLASESQRLPGAARNAGVAATSAPHVAFLAGDCRALPGWATGRLRHHRAGAPAVASALLPAARSTASVAAYLLAQSWRMPHLPRIAAPFPRLYRSPAAGASYGRRVLECHGPFEESLLAGEDTLFNDRLRDAGLPIAWAPDVVTEHFYPETVPAMLAEEYRRGRLRGSLHGGGRRRWRAVYAARASIEPFLALVRATDRSSALGPQRPGPLAALLLGGTLLRVAGILRAGRAAGPGAARFADLRHRRLVARGARGRSSAGERREAAASASLPAAGDA